MEEVPSRTVHQYADEAANFPASVADRPARRRNSALELRAPAIAERSCQEESTRRLQRIEDDD